MKAEDEVEVDVEHKKEVEMRIKKRFRVKVGEWRLRSKPKLILQQVSDVSGLFDIDPTTTLQGPTQGSTLCARASQDRN